MDVKTITPILNVSDCCKLRLVREVGLEEVLGLGHTPPIFGAVGAGESEIFLCQGAQGGRGKGPNTTTFRNDGDEAADHGVWMSVWVDDVDEVHKQCVAAALDVTFPPTNMPWKVREMHVRHPDGHVFRVSKGLNSET
ncbi:MAG TPA: bleomycin resistance family protein [Candidatus Acidoferrum sp.]|nr:bleomycin resistance family protein [Candidatus Acidoferrum sp.]